MKKLLFPALICLMMTGCQQQETNPFFGEYNTPYDIPPFEKIEAKHYMPAFEEGIHLH